MTLRRRMISVAVALVAFSALPFGSATLIAANQPTSDEEAAYTRAIGERADKIVATLEIDDSAKAARVNELIAGYYRGLREVHDVRDAKIDEATKSPDDDSSVTNAWINVARDQANLKVFEMHRRLVARLTVELSPAQIEKVKDGLTYGVVRITYKRYLEVLPTLSDEQKREILAILLEAREHAMDGGSSEEKHAVFGKYKGRINNYLSAEGFDLKAAEGELATRQRKGAQDR